MKWRKTPLGKVRKENEKLDEQKDSNTFIKNEPVKKMICSCKDPCVYWDDDGTLRCSDCSALLAVSAEDIFITIEMANKPELKRAIRAGEIIEGVEEEVKSVIVSEPELRWFKQIQGYAGLRSTTTLQYLETDYKGEKKWVDIPTVTE